MGSIRPTDRITADRVGQALSEAHPADVRRFRLCWFGQGVLVQESDGLESYLIQHGPYRDAEEAMQAVRSILEGGEQPLPQKQGGLRS